MNFRMRPEALELDSIIELLFCQLHFDLIFARPTTTWTEDTVYELGDLMVLIPKGDLARIPSATMWRTVSFLLEESQLMRRYVGSHLAHVPGHSTWRGWLTMYCKVGEE